MPSILEEDILLPAAPMDISDAQPTQPDRDLQRTVSAARPVPTHSERAPTACIPQESGSYGSSLDSEVLSPPLVSQTLLQSPCPMLVSFDNNGLAPPNRAQPECWCRSVAVAVRSRKVTFHQHLQGSMNIRPLVCHNRKVLQHDAV